MVLASVAPEIRVEDVLTAYVSGRLPGQPYSTRTAIVAGKEVTIEEPPPGDFQIFLAEMVVITKRTRNPTIADIIARNSPRLWDAIRMVNVATKGGYRGAGARGAALLFGK